MTLHMSNFKVLNHNHISWFSKDKPGNTTSRNRNVDLKTVSWLQGEVTRASRGFEWEHPMGWSRRMVSALLPFRGIARRWCTAQLLPRTIHCHNKSVEKRSIDGQGAGCSPASRWGRVRPELPAGLPGTGQCWGSMTCVATVLHYVYPHPSAFWLWTAEVPKKHLSQSALRFPTNSPWK